MESTSVPLGPPNEVQTDGPLVDCDPFAGVIEFAAQLDNIIVLNIKIITKHFLSNIIITPSHLNHFIRTHN